MKTLLSAALAVALVATPMAADLAAAAQPKVVVRPNGAVVVKPGPVARPKVVVKRRWNRGGRLPAEYRRNVVRDYGRYRLSRPPRGYNWVRVDNDYVLIGVATGIIASVIAGR